MKQTTALVILFATAWLLACSGSPVPKGDDPEDSLQGVRSENISDIIRMPVTAEGEVDSSLVPILEFEDRIFNFDTIYEGDIVEHQFKFRNIGQTSLVINNIRTSCGCTSPSWPKEPVEPGAESEILVKFNSAGKHGTQNKDITIYANTYPNTTVLKVYGVVESK